MYILKFVKNNLWLIITIIICIITAVYFGRHPDDYNAVCQILITLMVAILSIWAGLKYDNERLEFELEKVKRKAQLEATAKWMPMAKGCISKLLTMQQQVEDIKEVSMTAFSDIDKSDNIDCIKTLAKTEVRNRKASYKSINEQLDDAIEDWRRFVMANCQGNECSEVDDLIKNKRNKS